MLRVLAVISTVVLLAACGNSAKRENIEPPTALTELKIPEDGTRAGATMAVLVEDARWRTSARGKRYMMATVSDASGQFVASVVSQPDVTFFGGVVA